MTTTAQAATPPEKGEDKRLVRLAMELGIPPHLLLQEVKASGCETLADWKFAVIKEPDESHAKRLWKAVQGAPALDLGGMEMLAKQARSAPSRPGPARRVYKVGGRTLRIRPFAWARKGTQRKAIDLAKRQQAARALVELSWSWAPQAGLAKGCTDTRSETSLRRFQR